MPHPTGQPGSPPATAPDARSRQAVIDHLPAPGPDNASTDAAAAVDTGAGDDRGLIRHPDADAPDYQPHPQELSDAYDRGHGVPAGLTYSQYAAWATGPGLPAEVLAAAAAEHDRTEYALAWWDARADVLADLAAPARDRHPDLTAQMDDEQAATWHAHHDPAGVPALVEPAHLHAATDNALDLADEGFGLDA